MQIKPMPTSTALFKSKWNSLITKLSVQQQQKEEEEPRRKYSDAMSVGTFDSTTSMKDKFKQAMPFFRRRSSNNHNEESNSSTFTMPISSSSSSPNNNYCKELERLYSLYDLAVDELNYAEDSQGSSYYSGDLETAREALNNCNVCYVTILQNMIDPNAREELESCIAAKLVKLQKRMNALPEPEDDVNYY
ncbi:MAG: hypothetical protein EXX96DRAFT_554391 [Benjaminiella poitrasii]|nr:MAG: hypothetical protein EXX96DRAFT_554391 [Benjaminiella poitrasii]